MAEYVLVGAKYSKIIKASLENLGFNIIAVPDNPCLDPRVSGHADLSLFYDGNTLFAAKYLENSRFLNEISENILYIEENQDRKYPDDAQLNICLVGNSFIYNPKTASKTIIEKLKKQGREGIECKQGYSRCSVCVVDDNSIITADSSIALKCRLAGLDVLKITPGYFVLDGFEYGFIGGASINLDNRLLAFTGRLSSHPQYNDIVSFIQSKGVKIVYLTDLPAFDIGSAHVIKN